MTSVGIKDLFFKGQHIVNIIILICIVGLATYLLLNKEVFVDINFYLIVFLSLLYGVFFVLPIGGADMPVVISLLNSFTGVAAACGGFLYDNKVRLQASLLQRYGVRLPFLWGVKEP